MKDSLRVVGRGSPTTITTTGGGGGNRDKDDDEVIFPMIVAPGPVVSSSSSAPNNKVRKRRSPCQSVSSDALLRWDGDWLGPRLLSNSSSLAVLPLDDFVLRNGWTFAPRQCYLETFTTQELWAISKQQQQEQRKTVIAIWGTSRERGVFLSMVDMMLLPGANEKSNLEKSVVGKCWGRASVQLNHHLELIYQDVRTQLCDPRRAAGTIICHGDKMAQESGYMKNVTAMIKEWFDPNTTTSLESSSRPTVVLMFSGCYALDLIGPPIDGVTVPPHWCMQATAQILTTTLPADWYGTVYLTTGMIAADNIELTTDAYENYLHNLRWFHDHYLANDPRLRLLDLYGIATDMRLQAERPNKIHSSTHQHRWCDELNGRMRVCSNVTEAIANLLIGRAVAPLGKTAWRQENRDVMHWLSAATATTSNISLAPHERLIRVCTDCPRELLPFHIKITPELQCRDGGLVATDEPVGAVWNTPQCPASCMALEPVGQQKTQSGPVDIRTCVAETSTVQRQ
jgi:hypothetical protein